MKLMKSMPRKSSKDFKYPRIIAHLIRKTWTQTWSLSSPEGLDTQSSFPQTSALTTQPMGSTEQQEWSQYLGCAAYHYTVSAAHGIPSVSVYKHLLLHANMLQQTSSNRTPFALI